MQWHLISRKSNSGKIMVTEKESGRIRNRKPSLNLKNVYWEFSNSEERDKVFFYRKFCWEFQFSDFNLVPISYRLFQRRKKINMAYHKSRIIILFEFALIEAVFSKNFGPYLMFKNSLIYQIQRFFMVHILYSFYEFTK